MPTNWRSTKDYIDLEPGVRMGLAKRAQNQAEMNYREDAKAREVDRASTDQYRNQEMAMRKAEFMSRLGVEPVMAPDGTVDLNRTVDAARRQKELEQTATVLGHLHGIQGGPSSLTQEEYALTQTPQYKNAYAQATAQRAIDDARQAAVLEQIGARGKAAQEVAQAKAAAMPERQGRMATRHVTLPDGSTMAIPMDPEEAKTMVGPNGSEADSRPYDSAIEDVMRFKAAGEKVSFGTDDHGRPKVTKGSWLSNDASPGKGKQSYDAIIDKIMQMKGAGLPIDRAQEQDGGVRTKVFKAPSRR